MPEIEEKFLLMTPPSTPSSIPVFTPSYLITHFQFPSPSAPFQFTILISPQAIWALMLPARWTPNPVCSPSSLQYDHTSPRLLQPFPQTSATLPPYFCNHSPRLLQSKIKLQILCLLEPPTWLKFFQLAKFYTQIHCISNTELESFHL